MALVMLLPTPVSYTHLLYDPRFEHDNCGIGAVVDIKGRKSHKTIDDALQIVEHLEHRAGKDAEGKTGDGVGILTQISDTFFQKAAAGLGITLGSDRELSLIHICRGGCLHCGVAQRSMPLRGIEPHERASFAG